MLEKVLIDLKVSDDYLEAAKISALLHDLGCIHGKRGHALNSYKIAKEYFEERNIELEHQEELLKAIRDHGSSFESDSLMTLVLIMCDKIDLRKERLAAEGFETPGIRQLQFIEDVQVSIDASSCSVNFMSNQGLDIDELNTFKFLDKTFLSVESLARFLNRDAVVLINGLPWTRELTE